MRSAATAAWGECSMVGRAVVRLPAVVSHRRRPHRKTTLVNQIVPVLRAREGRLVSGKFDLSAQRPGARRLLRGAGEGRGRGGGGGLLEFRRHCYGHGSMLLWATPHPNYPTAGEFSHAVIFIWKNSAAAPNSPSLLPFSSQWTRALGARADFVARLVLPFHNFCLLFFCAAAAHTSCYHPVAAVPHAVDPAGTSPPAAAIATVVFAFRVRCPSSSGAVLIRCPG